MNLTTASPIKRSLLKWFPWKYRLILLVLVVNLSLLFFAVWKLEQVYDLSLRGTDSVMADREGNFYLVETRGCVRKFDPNYNFQGIWGGNLCLLNFPLVPPVGSLTLREYELRKLVADGQGNFYELFRDDDLTSIHKFDSTGTSLTPLYTNPPYVVQFANQADLAVDRDGMVYALDAGEYRILKFDSKGKFLSQWGDQGNRDDQFSQPLAIGLDHGGTVYILDRKNYIQKFDSSGRFLAKINLEVDKKTRNYLYLAVDGAGNLYLGEADLNYIQKFDSNGQVLARWETPGNAPGSSIAAMTLDDQGKVYVLHVNSASATSLQVYDSKGTLLKTLEGSDSETVLWLVVCLFVGFLIFLAVLILLVLFIFDLSKPRLSSRF